MPQEAMRLATFFDLVCRLAAAAPNLVVLWLVPIHVIAAADAGLHEVVMYRLIHLAVLLVSLFNIGACFLRLGLARIIWNASLVNVAYAVSLCLVFIGMSYAGNVPLGLSWYAIAFFCAIALVTSVLFVLRVLLARVFLDAM